MKRLSRESPSQYPIKIVQFGGGNFLRAYFDWMVDVLNEQTDFNGDVLLIKPTSSGSYTSLREQGGLYHISTKGIKDGKLLNDFHLVKCVQQVIHPYDEWEAYIDSARMPSIRFIISNTTESGIQFNSNDLFEDAPALEFPAKLTQWLFARWTHFEGDITKGCIILPCELINQNGVALRECILKYATHWNLSPEFTHWINEACHFANTLVDRIVTGFPKEKIEEVYQTIGYEDECIVEAEPYHLLVIEGSSIIQEELPFQDTPLNVVFTDDLNSYREIKVRILNGAHTSMVPVGYLAGVRTVKEAIDHPELYDFIHHILFENIIPTLNFPDEQLESYATDILERFKNPYIRHQLIDISLNSISKFKTRLLPSLLVYVKQTGEIPQLIVRALAALIVFYKGSYNQEVIPLRDDQKTIDYFKHQWSEIETNSQESPDQKFEKINIMLSHVLKNETFWGRDLSGINKLNSELLKHVRIFLNQEHVS